MKPYFKAFCHVCGNLAARKIRPGAWGEGVLSFFATTKPLKIFLYIIGLAIFLILVGQVRW